MLTHQHNGNDTNVKGKPKISATENPLFFLAFDNCLIPSLILTSDNGKIIVVNKATTKLLGYSKQELLTKSLTELLGFNNSSYKTVLKQKISKSPVYDLIKVIKKNGKTLACEITSAVFIGNHGIKKEMITISDMSQRIQDQKKIDSKKKKLVAEDIIVALAISDARLEENNEWIKYIAKTSYDVMWSWDIAKKEVYIGDSMEEVFGYKIQNNIVSIHTLKRCLTAGEKPSIINRLSKIINSTKKTWNDSFKFKRSNGSIASTISRASIIRNEEGIAIRMVGAIQDISRMQELEKKLANQNILQDDQAEKFLVTAKLSFDVIWEWNLITNEVFIGEGFEELFGYTINNNKTNKADLNNYLHPEDKANIEKGLHHTIDSDALHWEHAYRLIRADGSIAKVFNKASIIRDTEGKAYRMLGSMQDLSRQKELQEKLDHEITANSKNLKEYSERFTL
ncbi:MAG TPA: PAS domain-containing protein, partial [Flavisolibacter sp.]|nr:PAS domain-containing protein [Flavisolibacter sp.]